MCKRLISLIVIPFVFIIVASCAAYPPLPTMVLVKGGTYDMGIANGKDNPLHKVEVSSFCIAPYDVTVADWREFTSQVDIGWKWNKDYTGAGGSPTVFHADDPIEYVTWYEALEYCNWLSRKYGLTPAYKIEGTTKYVRINGQWTVQRAKVTWNKKANGFRLPTEAEWEYAARGGDRSRGTIYAGSNDLGEVGWYKVNSGGEVHPVGQKKPNELGLYDMSGDVAQWCWDFYSGAYFAKSPTTNPTGPDKGRISDPEFNGEYGAKAAAFLHVIRGSYSWEKSSESTLTIRAGQLDYQRFETGFRVVRNAN